APLPPNMAARRTVIRKPMELRLHPARDVPSNLEALQYPGRSSSSARWQPRPPTLPSRATTAKRVDELEACAGIMLLLRRHRNRPDPAPVTSPPQAGRP